MWYLYVLQSLSGLQYYVGISHHPFIRLEEHNTSDRNTYTSKHRPWKMVALFEAGATESEALRMERFIKRQHSSKLLAKLVEPDFVPNGVLAKLVRVPHVRD